MHGDPKNYSVTVNAVASSAEIWAADFLKRPLWD